jgi:lactate dehydrogenase-like 2-hydroxyacid dehydrogenase
MTKIFVPQAIPQPAIDLLKTLGDVTIFPESNRVISESELLEAVRDKDILYAMGEIPYDAKIIDAAKSLKFISAMHSSAKFVDFAAATQRNVPVSGVPHATKITAEFTFALLMSAAW